MTYPPAYIIPLRTGRERLRTSFTIQQYLLTDVADVAEGYAVGPYEVSPVALDETVVTEVRISS